MTEILVKLMQRQVESDRRIRTPVTSEGLVSQGYWSASYEAWTYASATTFTIEDEALSSGELFTDFGSIYQPGDFIRLKQGGAFLHGCITAVAYADPTTTVTIVGDAIADAAITDNYYSKAMSPQGRSLLLGVPYYKDINLGAALLTKPAANAPGTDEFVDENGDDTDIETYAFDVGDRVSGNFEIQHDYKEGTDIIFHVHFQIIDAPTGTDKVKWGLIYTLGRAGETLDAAVTITAEQDVDTQYEFYILPFPAITGTNIDIETQFLFRLRREAASGDEFAGDALIATVGLHYEVNTLGSRQISTK